MVEINGKQYEFDAFAWDGCHKIYLLNKGTEEHEEAGGCGYFIMPIADLRKIWRKSCGLRFVNIWDEDVTTVIPQFGKLRTFSTDETY